MKDTAQQKGDKLENAVRAIETRILSVNPNLRNGCFKIEPKKIIYDSAGVKHEIDLYVTISIGGGYDSVYIFECKNWQKPIGKNEIIVFAEKIKVCNAQTGFFVAKAFGKYAKVQAEKDERIKLLEAIDDVPLPDFLESFHMLEQGVTGIQVGFDLDEKEIRNNTSEVTEVYLSGEKQDFRQYAQSISNKILNEFSSKFPSNEYKEGKYEFCIRETITPDSILKVNGNKVIGATFSIHAHFSIINPHQVNSYYIPSKGSNIEFIYLHPTTKQEIRMSFTL